MSRPLPIAAMRGDEALFETYHTATDGVMLVMLPHGADRTDERYVGWDLTRGARSTASSRS